MTPNSRAKKESRRKKGAGRSFIADDNEERGCLAEMYVDGGNRE